MTLFASLLVSIGMAQSLGAAFIDVTTSGNPNMPNGIWPNQTFLVIDSSFSGSLQGSYTFITDQNGISQDSIPLISSVGFLNFYSVCNGASVLLSSATYQVTPAFPFVNILVNLNICSNGPASSNGLFDISGILIGNSTASGAWPNETIYIEDHRSNGTTAAYTDVTNAIGEFNQMFLTTSFSGYVKLYAFNCNGDSVVSNLPYQFNSLNDTLSYSVVMSDSCFAPPANLLCNSSFVVDTVNSLQGQVVLWNDSQSMFINTLTQYVWDFGDGTIVVGQYPTHQYAQAGVYNVCLTMYELDNIGDTLCSSTYCDTLGMDVNGNLIYKGMTTGFSLIVIDPSTIGLEEESIELVAYPNPAKESIQLSGLEGMEANYSIFDMSGRSVKEGRLDANSSVNIAELSNGLYLLNIQSNQVLETIRIQIKH